MPNEVHFAHILVKTVKDATGVLERLKKREKFATIAKDVSICPSKKAWWRPKNLQQRKDGEEIRESRVRSLERTNFTDYTNKVWIPHH